MGFSATASNAIVSNPTSNEPRKGKRGNIRERVQPEMLEHMLWAYRQGYLSIAEAHVLVSWSAQLVWPQDTSPFITVRRSDRGIPGRTLKYCVAHEAGPGHYSLSLLCFCSFLTGTGSCAAFSSAIKTGQSSNLLANI